MDSYEHFNVLEYLIKMRTPTTEIFGSNLLVSAARLEDTKTALELINLGVDVNTPSGRTRNTALYEAAKTRNVHLVQVLLQAGADPNAETFSTTPLQEAISGTINTELVRILLEAGADANRVSAYKSPLLSAAQKTIQNSFKCSWPPAQR